MSKVQLDYNQWVNERIAVLETQLDTLDATWVGLEQRLVILEQIARLQSQRFTEVSRLLALHDKHAFTIAVVLGLLVVGVPIALEVAQWLR